MLNLFKKTIQHYPKLGPTERIPKIIEEFIYPPLEKKDFKILKSGLSIKRTIDIFQQEIWFSKSKWNIENEICAFTPHFTVTLKNYKKWHLSEYGEQPMNDVLESHAANYINSWNKELFDNDDYNLAKDDNSRIVQLLNENIANYGLPFLERLSNYESAVEHLMKSERFYLAPKMIDICIIKEDFQTANDVLSWFRNYERTGKSEFMESTLKDMNQRECKITGA
tara:strand:- start:63 stop:734 length:672 start_codon:yes stop_codon:yes gene_type:complete